ncbi:MAG: winged helix-turn-helix domain-containing protein, partial [Nitrososphaerales archaeon]
QKNYRDRLGIIESILIKAGIGCRKTRIMYGANLSTVQLKRYLDMLVRIGCLAYDGENRLFRVTQKGNDLLEAICNVSRAKEELRRSRERLEAFIGTGQISKDASDRIFQVSRFNRLLDTSRSTKFITTLVDIERVRHRR